MSNDLLRIGVSGLGASSTLLATTSKNISNIDTPGYSRQRTEYVSTQFGGVGQGTTTRLMSEFAERQLLIDTSNFHNDEVYVQRAEYLNNILSGDANSLSTVINSFFDAVQTATDNPTGAAGRQQILAQSESLLDRFQVVSNIVREQETAINGEIQNITTDSNELIRTIADLNKQIQITKIEGQDAPPPELLDQRDQAIRELSEYMEISTLDQSDGTKTVNLKTGQSLVLADGTFSVFSVNGDPDPNRLNLQLTANGSNTFNIGVDETLIGGQLGGLLEVRDDIIEPVQRELGQIGLALSDAMNEQNRLGMDLDGELGVNMFTLPTSQSLSYSTNANNDSFINVQVVPGDGEQLTASDYLVTMNTATTFTIQAVDLDGNPVGTATGPLGPIPAAGTYTAAVDGLQLDFQPGAGFAAGDRFLLQPTKDAAQGISFDLTRGEDIALASPIRTDSRLTNTGSGVISPGVVSNTDPATSDFTAPGGLTTDPIFVRYNGGNSFEVYDSDPSLGGATLLGTANFASTQYNDVMAQAGAPLNAYGYDFNISGAPSTGDVFTVGYNTNGIDDNRNGLLLSGLQTSDQMRKNVVNTADNSMTFNEAYGNIISDVGGKTSIAQVRQTASQNLLNQSSAWRESISGVNLDEEAANLIKFQQSYSAAARIITTSQTIFDTLLSAVR